MHIIAAPLCAFAHSIEITIVEMYPGWCYHRNRSIDRLRFTKSMDVSADKEHSLVAQRRSLHHPSLIENLRQFFAQPISKIGRKADWFRSKHQLRRRPPQRSRIGPAIQQTSSSNRKLCAFKTPASNKVNKFERDRPGIGPLMAGY